MNIEILSGASILDFLVRKKYTLTNPLNRSKGVSKHLSFYTNFKNVHLTLVKSATQKMISQIKNIFLAPRQIFNWQNSVLSKTFLGCTLYQDQIYIFEKKDF
jgi:hypothetical protein